MAQQPKRTLSDEVAQAEAEAGRAREAIEAAEAQARIALREITMKLMQGVADAEARAEALRHLASQVERSIPGASDVVGIRDMRRHVPLPRGGQGAGRPTKSKHPFPRAVGNVAAWAEQQGLSYSFVKAWYTTGESLKPIPRKWQVLLEKTYGIPASAWRGGIGQRD